jgi:hypothetical protein
MRLIALRFYLRLGQSLKRPAIKASNRMSKLSIRAGMKRISPTDRARSRLQSMAATFVSAAPDDVPGLRHSPQTTDKGDKQVAAEYREKTPYRPLSDRGCNQWP